MTCAKVIVKCEIVTREGISVHGENLCRAPQAVCPRSPDEGYEKCATVCDQRGHAEEQALQLAAKLGLDVRGGTAIIRGHYVVCRNCAVILRDAGIKYVIVENEDGVQSSGL